MCGDTPSDKIGKDSDQPVHRCSISFCAVHLKKKQQQTKQKIKLDSWLSSTEL